MQHNKTKKQITIYWLGGICATLIPVIIGITLLVIPTIIDDKLSCRRTLNNRTYLEDFYCFFGEEYYYFLLSPIFLSFIFVAPLVAFICVSKLLDEVEIEWGDIFRVSMSKSTLANLWVAAIYNIGLILIVLYTAVTSPVGLRAFYVFFIILVITIIIQFILWLLLTLPLSLICGGFFGLFVRPK